MQTVVHVTIGLVVLAVAPPLFPLAAALLVTASLVPRSNELRRKALEEQRERALLDALRSLP